MILTYTETPFLTNPGPKSGHLLESVEKRTDVILTRVIGAGNVTGQSLQCRCFVKSVGNYLRANDFDETAHQKGGSHDPPFLSSQWRFTSYLLLRAPAHPGSPVSLCQQRPGTRLKEASSQSNMYHPTPRRKDSRYSSRYVVW
jgi:hypothetical protein